MIRPQSIFNLGHMQPPVRRVLAIDPGSRNLRVLLAESHFGRLRIIKEDLIDLLSEGLVSADETKAHLQTMLEELGRPPLALVLPQNVTTSQTIDLPSAPESEVEKLIEGEALKLSGVSQSPIVYDFVRTETGAKNRQQFWVTLTQEGEIRNRIQRLGIEREDICEVTTTANALIAAYRAVAGEASRTILVHFGAQMTIIVILLDGQGAFATSFPMGGDSFTRALATATGGPESTAEKLKLEKNLFTGEDAAPEFASVVESWVVELKRQLNDWFADKPAMAANVASFRLVASGGGFSQAGLLDYLRTEAGLDFSVWPKPTGPETPLPLPGFEVAYGTALQALGHTAQPVSLLPKDYRAAWQKRLFQQRIELASFVVLVLCVLLLAAGTWHKLSLIDRKSSLLDKTVAAQEASEVTDTLTGDLTSQYETLRPVFAAEQNTRDMLKTLALLQQSRSNHSLWYALVADQQSYFNPPSHLVPTNRLVRPSATAALITVERYPTPYVPTTNASPAKPGCIAELSMEEEGEAARTALSQVVNSLKQQKIFSKVDSLSDDLRRNLADPKVVILDRYFALSLDFADTDFLQPVKPKKPPVSGRAAPKRKPPRVSWNGFDEAGRGGAP